MKRILKYSLAVLLCFITSIPVVTLAASITALHFVGFKLASGEDVEVCTEYFKSFKMNFAQSLPFLVIILAVGAGLFYSWKSLLSSGDGNMIMIFLVFIATCLYFSFESMSTYLLSKFANTTKRLMLITIYAVTKRIDLMIKLSVAQSAVVAVPVLIYYINPSVVSLIIAIVLFIILLIGYEVLASKAVLPVFEMLIKEQEESLAKRAAEAEASEASEEESGETKEENSAESTEE